jgi:hypothetical protein
MLKILVPRALNRSLSTSPILNVDGAKAHWERRRKGRRPRGWEFNKRFRISTMGGHWRKDPAVVKGQPCPMPYNPTWDSGKS